MHLLHSGIRQLSHFPHRLLLFFLGFGSLTTGGACCPTELSDENPCSVQLDAAMEMLELSSILSYPRTQYGTLLISEDSSAAACGLKGKLRTIECPRCADSGGKEESVTLNGSAKKERVYTCHTQGVAIYIQKQLIFIQCQYWNSFMANSQPEPYA